MERKINQHYVWKWYLNSWTKSDKIYCLRKKSLFNTNPRNIASQREFYSVPVLNQNIEEALRLKFVYNANPILKDINENWISMFSMTSEAKKVFPENNLFDSLEENLYSEIENDLKPFVEAMLLDKLEFLEDDNTFQPFLFSFVQQYFRTKKMRETMKRATDSFNSNPDFDMWPVVRHLLATTLAFNLISKKEYLAFTILKSIGNQRFITGDQPLINLFATDKKEKEEIQDLKFYYPLSPDRALLVDLNSEKKGKIYDILETDVIDYNKHIYKQSLESLFAKEREDLLNFYEASHNKE